MSGNGAVVLAMVLLLPFVVAELAWDIWPVLRPKPRRSLPAVGEIVDVADGDGDFWPFRVTRIEGRQVWAESVPDARGIVKCFGEKPLGPKQYVRRGWR